MGLTGPNSDSRTTWIHVAPIGTWEGHADGAFSLTAQDFRSIIDHEATKATPCSLDYEHASIAPSGGPTPAAGYVQAFDLRSDGLWARVEFTPRAAEMIKAGEYRFCSGVFDFAATDPVSGSPIACVMDSIALTNRPFVDGMEPISLSRRRPLTGVSRMTTITREALDGELDKLGSDTLDPETIGKIVAALAAMAEATTAPEAPAAPETAKPEEDAMAAAKALAAPQDPSQPADPSLPTPSTPVPAADSPQMAAPPPMPTAMDPDMDAMTDAAMAKVMAATGLDDAGLAAAIEANLDALVSLLMGTAATMDPNMPVAPAMSRDLMVKTLTTRLTAATKELNEHRAKERTALEVALTSEVEALVTTGRVEPKDRKEWLALAKRSPSEFRAMSKLLPAGRTPVGRHATALPAPIAGSETLGESVLLDPKDANVIALTREIEAGRKAAGLAPAKEPLVQHEKQIRAGLARLTKSPVSA